MVKHQKVLKYYIHDCKKSGLLPEEQKRCRERSYGTKDQILIDKAVIKNWKKRKINFNIVSIDLRRAYDMVPHSWMIKFLEMVGTTRNIVNLLKETMKNCQTNLICRPRNSENKPGNLPRYLIVSITVCSTPPATDTSTA